MYTEIQNTMGKEKNIDQKRIEELTNTLFRQSNDSLGRVEYFLFENKWRYPKPKDALVYYSQKERILIVIPAEIIDKIYYDPYHIQSDAYQNYIYENNNKRTNVKFKLDGNTLKMFLYNAKQKRDELLLVLNTDYWTHFEFKNEDELINKIKEATHNLKGNYKEKKKQDVLLERLIESHKRVLEDYADIKRKFQKLPEGVIKQLLGKYYRRFADTIRQFGDGYPLRHIPQDLEIWENPHVMPVIIIYNFPNLNAQSCFDPFSPITRSRYWVETKGLTDKIRLDDKDYRIVVLIYEIDTGTHGIERLKFLRNRFQKGQQGHYTVSGKLV